MIDLNGKRALVTGGSRGIGTAIALALALAENGADVAFTYQHFAKAVIPHLAEGGRTISIGSGLGERVPFPGVKAYAMSKAALTSFTHGLSRELGPNGITVNLVQPGPTDTDANPAYGAGAEFQRSLMPLGRFGEPHEVASAVVYLASPAASAITGAILTAERGSA